MKTVWKYVLEDFMGGIPQAVVPVPVPKGSKPISVGEQYEKMVVYCEVDDSVEEKEELIFAIAGTGHEMPFEDDVQNKFLGTVKLKGGAFMFHIYQLIKENNS